MTQTIAVVGEFDPAGTPQTVAATKTFQARAGITGPDADGTNVGPRTLAAAWAAGYRG